MAIVRKQLDEQREQKVRSKTKAGAKSRTKTGAEAKPRKKTVRRFTPQQIEFGLWYFLPTSPTFGNAYQSALKADYSESYAKSITPRGLEWLENLLYEIVRNFENSDTKVPEYDELMNLSLIESFKALKGDDRNLAIKVALFIMKSNPKFSEKKDLTSGGEKIGAEAVVVEFAKEVQEFLDGAEKGEDNHTA